MKGTAAARRAVVVAVAAALAVGGPAGGALAQEEEPVSVTLRASRTTLDYGRSTRLAGAISPAMEGETVDLVDADSGEVLLQVTTDADGAFAAELAPERNTTLVARWGAAQSDPVALGVRPLLQARLRNVFLFGKARVKGRMRPPLPGASVTVSLLRGKAVAAKRSRRTNATGKFSVRLPVQKPGRYRAKVELTHADFLPVSTRTGRRKTPLPSLSQGARAKTVRHLEARLRRLRYRIVGVNRRFDHRTADAVLAFHKVQGMPRTKSVSEATWRRLAKPRRPKPRASRPAFHVEIDQTRQVLYVVKRGEIRFIVHTSTGAGGATRDGVFSVHRKIAGYSPNRLWYPSYFDGNRAVHGWPSVPTYPASHGCSRVPNWTAVWLHGLMDYGTQVRVYH